MKINNKEIKKTGGYTCGEIYNSFLIWTLREIGAVEVANVLQEQYDGIKTKDNCEYMEEYRKIESDFFEGYDKKFSVIDGEIQNKLFA